MANMSDENNSANCDNSGQNESLVNSSSTEQGSEDTPSDGNAVEGQQQPSHEPTRLESFLAVTKSLIVRALIIYFITSFFRRPQTGTPGPPGSAQPTKLPAFNIFENGTLLDVHMYLSEDREFDDFKNAASLFWVKKGVVYGDWYSGEMGDGAYTHSTTFKPSEALLTNGSIYLHVYLTRHGASPDRSSKSFAGQEMSYGLKQLNKFKRQKYLKTHNLLTGETALTAEQLKIAENRKGEVVSHWHPNLTVNLVTDHTNWVQGSVPPPLDEYIVFLPHGDKYKPVLFMNDFWNMGRDYQPINKTVEELQLQVTLQPLSLFRWQLYSSQAMRNKWSNLEVFGDTFGGEEEEEDHDSLKEALLETSPYLLGLTITVSILHSIFELLAFKNDIQFWNNRKSLEGLSVRSVFFNVFQSLVVMLYVFDNDTNTLVRISCVIGLLIEVWKINKVMDIQIDWQSRVAGVLPRLSLKDKGSYVESSTREYDILAFKYLSWAVYPLLAGFGVYSLLYNEHKGWYSFVLSMLYGFLLTFGFIMMTPQLFINYKLKSVAHLPWRMMTYKALNTFIDDIFAFVIKMPTMYRLGCFRDDIVFFIFLYQKFIYKTDPTRVNEFGFSAEMEDEVKNKKQVQTPAPLAIEGQENGSATLSPKKKMADKKKD